MISTGKIFLLSVFLGVLASGCHYFRTDANEYVVTVKFVGDSSGQRIENVSVIIGSDKFWWASFDENEEKTVNLFTEKNPSTNLTLLYSIDSDKRSWESAEFSESNSYRIRLEVAADGSVKENFCKMPCRL